MASKPIAGYVGGGIVALFTLVFSALTLYRLSGGQLTPAESLMITNFPALGPVNALNNVAAMIVAIGVLAGIAMSAAGDENGNRVVRAWAIAGILVTTAGAFIASYLARNSASWALTDSAFRSGFFAALAGAVLFASITWGIVIFLFRDRSRAP